MGVYIKGLEMPKSCSECFVKFCNGRAKNKRIMVQRGANCPLVPVPPHGDLIDRDKLREKEFIHGGDAYAAVMSLDIRNAPTIIPAEEGE